MRKSRPVKHLTADEKRRLLETQKARREYLALCYQARKAAAVDKTGDKAGVTVDKQGKKSGLS